MIIVKVFIKCTNKSILKTKNHAYVDLWNYNLIIGFVAKYHSLTVHLRVCKIDFI